MTLAPVQNNVIEQVLIGGDLAKLTPPERLMYYKNVCASLGLNPLTRPFDYITLNGKLTLYARKDAAEQLRDLRSVSIDDVNIKETDTQFIVTTKGHDKTGRTDVEIGVVNKTDMRGDLANALMKCVTKSKRRFTLSICGLGMLDETEVETIPQEAPVPQIVEHDGDLAEVEVSQSKTDSKRPLSPQTLADMLDKKSLQYRDKKASDAQRGLLVGMLGLIFRDDDNKRQTVQEFLFGTTHAKDIPDEFILAGLDWLKPVKDSGDAYIPDPMAEKEAQAVWTFCLKIEGQEELL